MNAELLRINIAEKVTDARKRGSAHLFMVHVELLRIEIVKDHETARDMVNVTSHQIMVSA